jgi:hypothetical protein
VESCNFAQRQIRVGGKERRKNKIKQEKKDIKVEDGFTSLSVHKIVLIHFFYVLIGGLIISLIISAREKKNIQLISFRLSFLGFLLVFFFLLSLSHGRFSFIYVIYSLYISGIDVRRI